MAITPKVTTTQTTVVDLKPAVRRKLLNELRAFQELKSQRDAVDAAMNAHKATIGKLRESTGETTLALEGFKVSYVTPTRKVLDQKKLIELGCAIAWIEEATEHKPTKPYEKISCPGEKEVDY